MPPVLCSWIQHSSRVVGPFLWLAGSFLFLCSTTYTGIGAAVFPRDKEAVGLVPIITQSFAQENMLPFFCTVYLVHSKRMVNSLLLLRKVRAVLAG